MKRNLFLFFTAFICGNSIMAVELTCTRFIAPYYGSSQITWTIVIGIIMLAISSGNIIGGIFADRPGNKDVLYHFMIAAALWISLIPVAGKAIIACSSIPLMVIFPENILIAGVTLSCITIFAFPCILLGAAPPLLVKLAMTDLENNGKAAGEIYAVSTIGSIVGTFIPTFLTIPSIGTGRTFQLFAVILALTSLIHFFRQRRHVFQIILICTGLALIFLFSPSGAFAFWKENIIEAESQYNYIQISKDDSGMHLSTHVEIGQQSVSPKDNKLTECYWDKLLLAPFFSPECNFEKPVKTLILGFCGGTQAKLLKRFFSACEVEGVEIDNKILELAYSNFGLKKTDAKVFIDDGRTFFSRPEAGKYDVVFLDAFHDVYIPFHMATREYFEIIKNHLAPDGTLAININMRSERSPELINYVLGTVKSVFPKTFRYDPPDLPNVIIFASSKPDCRSFLQKNLSNIPNNHVLAELLNGIEKSLSEVTESKLIFTDDKAPVELLSQRVLNDVLKDAVDMFFVLSFIEVSKNQ
ncbi:MAG: fused MFS/spermidine synthase [Candidatus Riflebacteria bacterium]|nr:fused MFS/spermidine synthase [Candidatus Riflebacteria bacterium]